MMRSTLSNPLGLSSSYFTFEPSGISITAWKSRGNSLPGDTSCHACNIEDPHFAGIPLYYRVIPTRRKAGRSATYTRNRIADTPRTLAGALVFHGVVVSLAWAYYL